MSSISQEPRIFSPETLPSKSRGGGARTIPLVTGARGATTYLNGITIFEPSAAIGHHIHNVAESVMVIQGNAIVDVDGVRTPLKQFDTTFVPANIPHHFENSSSTVEMRIFWTYGSIDATRTLLESGERGRVDSEGPAELSNDQKIVREVASFVVKPGHQELFEEAVRSATPLFQAATGARTFTLDQVDEDPTRYRLVVAWETVENHTVDFRQSAAFQEWQRLIGDHLGGSPVVEHVRQVYTGF